jgi:hypothetical protein
LTSRVKAARRVIGDDGRTDKNDPVDTLILDRMDAFQNDGSGYLAIQNTRPQTIGYGLVDSPLLQLAWIAEKVHEWTDLPVDRDQLLTSVSLYWFTGSGVTAAHTMYEQAHSSDWGAPAAVPQGFAVFGADETARKLVPAPAEAHWTEFPRGKHFPAMEAPPSWRRTCGRSSGHCHDQCLASMINSARWTRRPAVGPLPMAPVHDVVERAPVGLLDRCERAIGRRAERDQHGTEPVLGKAHQAPGELLVVDACMGAADAEVGRGQHDAHRRLAQIELDQVAHQGVVGPWGQQRDRRRRVGDVASGGPNLGELGKLLPVSADHEVPCLLVAGRGRAPRGLQNPTQVLGRDLAFAVGPHVASGRDRIPSLHIDLRRLVQTTGAASLITHDKRAHAAAESCPPAYVDLAHGRRPAEIDADRLTGPRPPHREPARR